MNVRLFQKWIRAAAVVAAFVCPAASVLAVNLTPLPPYLTEIKGAPMVMLNLSRDHQLSYKAYNEFSDLDGDGVIEVQYSHSYNYYGYFDNQRCYTYVGDVFVPGNKVDATTRYCNVGSTTNQWSGNFLNWATMTRMDVVRRILYGGYRSTDTDTQAILERAYLPTDAHAFAKYYKADDIGKLTPFNKPEITMCNATYKNGGNQYSQNAIGSPKLLVADGNYSLWNANERWQCYWSEDKSASNGNVPSVTGLDAANSNPSRSSKGLGTGIAQGTYVVRVEVCKQSMAAEFTDDEKSRCKLYPSGQYKPVGLLQKYGERNEAAFGLITGSYSKNISGGVLRKNVSSFTNEVDPASGRFTISGTADSIVRTLNNIRPYGYDYNDGTYTGLDKCNFLTIGLTEGQCASWGNPIGEMFLEALRYLAGAGKTGGAGPTPAFNTTGTTLDSTLGLTVAAWADPFDASTVATFGDRTCRRSNVINFNASVSTYDNNQWDSANAVNGLSQALVVSRTNDLGSAEGLYVDGKKWTVGRTADDTNNFCSDKTIGALATSVGICPEAPTGYGGFLMGGAAEYAHTSRIRTDIAASNTNTRAFKVDTYGVALATAVPRIKVPVPNQDGKFVVIQPAMRYFKDGTNGGAGALVDFRVVSQSATQGKFVVQWEDSEQGGDYDQDMWGTLEYSVNTASGDISVTTYAHFQSTDGNKLGFGYAIAGTNGKDGVHLHSGVNGASFTDPVNIRALVTPTARLNNTGGCNSCNAKDPATTAVYHMTGVSGDALQDPMWYAAKYGGFDRSVVPDYASGQVLPTAAWDSKKSDGTIGSDGIPDNYFYAIDPAQLERSLNDIFASILRAGGAAPAAATAARTQTGGYVYASTQSIKAKEVGSAVDADASGQFLRYSFDANGDVKTSPDWDAGAKLTVSSSGAGWSSNRKVLSLSPTAPIAFRWDSLADTQQSALTTSPATGLADGKGEARLQWLRGDSSNEGDLRIRPVTKLGAIINSTPWYEGAPAAGYTNAQYGGGYGAFRTGITTANGGTARSAVYVGANDGMLHAFDGTTGTELFAYVPRAFYTTSTAAPYSKLAAITAKDFNLGESTGRLTMDGSMMTADVKPGTAWATYLFGAFGRGARGVFALDVTKPHTITEAAPANLVKWEFTEQADQDIGYITGRTNARSNGQPYQTGYMANGKWAAIYGNGYNSTSRRAGLFILFANGPNTPASTAWTANTQYVKIMTPVVGTDEANGADNGLATPTAIDTNNDGVIDRIYAGDLKGNVWRFEVSDPDPTKWRIFNTADGTATGTPVPLYKATTMVGNVTVPQPITTPIVPFPNPKGGYQLFFATGKSLESNDYPMSSVYTNTMYGIYDKPSNTGTLTTGRTNLVQQTITETSGVRYLTSNEVNYGADDLGWYADLPVGSEGVVFNPFSEDTQRVNVRSLAPAGTSDGCRTDGISYDMVLNPINGTPIANAVPGVTTSGAIGTSNTNYFEGSSGGKFSVPSSSDSTPEGETPPPPPLCAGQCLYRSIISAGDGTLKTVSRCGACNAGRLTWREIFRNR